MTLFLAGDVMTGRGIDQILGCPSAPEIHEPYVRDARDYVMLAERASGPISRSVDAAYIWGAALDELDRRAPTARIVNLETSVTRSDDYWRGKGINYRMHPDNIACLTAAKLDVCTLANNHVLDYRYSGLEATLATLAAAGIRVTGAGRDAAEASRPAILAFDHTMDRAAHRLLVWSVADESSGVPRTWGATPTGAGVDFLPDLTNETADAITARYAARRRPGDVAMISVHWGSNWGYHVPSAQVSFAHRLIDGGIDLVHGHSSHHPRPIETYRGKLILYGCGDLLHDYEGISGYEEYRNDLVLMYFPQLDPATGRLMALRMVPLRVAKFRLHHASAAEREWMRDRLNDCSSAYGTCVRVAEDGSLVSASITGR